MELKYTTIDSDFDFEQIIRLQTENLRLTKSPEEEKEQGFVTVQHDISILKEMNESAKHVVAKDGDKIVGYALAMTRDFNTKIPILGAMFESLDDLILDGKRVGDGDYIVMGQVCIDKPYRGQGVFAAMYDYYFKLHKPVFGYVITEVAARNTRSVPSSDRTRDTSVSFAGITARNST